MAKIPTPANEPVYGYAKGSDERAALVEAIEGLRAETVEIPIVAGGEALKSGDLVDVVEPHAHRRVLARAHRASPEQTQKAIDAAVAAAPAWAATPFEDRAGIFLRAAELLTQKHRAYVNAACMLGQSKSAHQAEIDAVCELVDFWRFNVGYTAQILEEGRFQHPNEDVTIFVARITEEGVLERVLLSDRRGEGPPVIYTADQALMIETEAAPQLVMIDGVAQRLEDGRTLSVLAFESFAFDLGELAEEVSPALSDLRAYPTAVLFERDPTVMAGAGASEVSGIALARAAAPPG